MKKNNLNYQFNNFLLILKKKYKKIPAIAIAYSGGADSAALLRKVMFCKKIKNFKVFHINHGINKNSDLWELFCKNYCLKNNIEYDTIKLKFNKKKVSEKDMRKERYKALGILCKKYNINLLFTAHQQDDQIETIVFNIFRGCGINGVLGIKNISDIPGLTNNENLFICRPFLNVSRKNIEEYNKIYNIKYINDDSNDNLYYSRNIIRKKILPTINKFFPYFNKTFLRFIEHLKNINILINSNIKDDLNKCMINKKCLNIEKIKKINNNIRICNLLYLWIKELDLYSPSYEWINTLYKKIIKSKNISEFFLENRILYIEKKRCNKKITLFIKNKKK